MATFRVLRIASNLANWPEFRPDTEEFPELQERIPIGKETVILLMDHLGNIFDLGTVFYTYDFSEFETPTLKLF